MARAGGKWWISQGLDPALAANPLAWSVPVGSIAGITIRVSLIYILWMILTMVSSKQVSPLFTAWSIGSLFVLVLLHELGHCFACRRVGGEADHILMWMLGGLASCRPPHNWRASLITTIGGPGVNLALVPLLAGTLFALGAPIGSLFFNPWGSGVGNAFNDAGNGIGTRLPAWGLMALFTLHLSNLTLLLFNTLLVFFPFDGGRIVQELLWRRMGYAKSMWIATGVGLVGGGIVATVGLIAGELNLTLIGLFGAFTCWQQRQQFRFITQHDAMGDRWNDNDGESWKEARSRRAAPATALAAAATRKSMEQARKAAEKDRAAAAAQAAELDRILAKIKSTGMGSLSSSEQAFLRRSSQSR